MLLVQLTDLHVRPRGLAAYRVAETNMLTERAFRAVRALGARGARPDAVVISGDLTENGLVAEYQQFAEVLGRTLGHVPVYVVPGNHDRREVLRAELSHLPGIAGCDRFIQFAVEDHALRLVMLDTVVPGAGHGILCADRLAWLDATLADAPERPTVIVMHHPPIICGIRHMDAINLHDAEAFAAVIARHRQVRRIVCGHHHRPITGQVAHAIVSVAPSVAHQVELDLNVDDPGAWNLEPPAFHIHLTADDGGLVTHTAYVESFPGPFPFMTDADYPGKPGPQV
jgi:Icc protein